MPTSTPYTAGLISIIIACYNHGQYLLKAIQSIWQQNYPAIEIIIIDDGSTDNTQELVKELPGIKYLYQTNQGLSAARNTGIKISTGEYLVFLDSDDWLFPGALTTNLNYLQRNESLAFISGALSLVYMETGQYEDIVREINQNHYWNLLQGNYIAITATVMFRRWVFDEFLFDVSLRNCEDYDIYLKITRKYPVFHHKQKIAAYRKHSSNKSNNIPKMVATVVKLMNRQKEFLRSAEEKTALKNGLFKVKRDYCNLLYHQFLVNKSFQSKEVLFTLLKYQPKLLFKYFFKIKL